MLTLARRRPALLAAPLLAASLLLASCAHRGASTQRSDGFQAPPPPPQGTFSKPPAGAMPPPAPAPARAHASPPPAAAAAPPAGERMFAGPDSSGTTPKFGDYVYVEELPEAATKVAPDYPEAARAAGVTGIVMVQALVRTDGTVGDVRVVKSIPPLDEAAKACVRQWTFKPALVAGKPVAVWVGVPVKFSLP